MTSWASGRMVGLDTETTGTDPLSARIVTAAVVHVRPGYRPDTISWVIDPGCEVPQEAAAVHGWTRARILEKVGGPGMAVRIDRGQTHRLDADGALFEIAAQAATVMHTDIPLVVHNAAYDLTLLEAELIRNGIDTLASRPSGIRGVVDPMVMEKAWDPYRKLCYRAPGCRPAEQHHECTGCQGSKRYDCGQCGVHDKTLGGLCRHYGLRLPSAHNAAGDAVAAIRLATKLAGLWPDIARLRLPTLHAHQGPWRKAQMDGLRSYFDKNGIEHDGCDPGWPLLSGLQQLSSAGVG